MSVAIPTLTLQAVTRVEPDSRTGDIAGQARAEGCAFVARHSGHLRGPGPDTRSGATRALLDLPKGGAFATVAAHLHDSAV